MSTRREEEERRVYQMVNSRGNRQEYVKKNQFDLDEVIDNDFREINPIYGCLVPCLKCCIYPCRAFFLTGRCISQKRRTKKTKFDTRNPQYNNGKYNQNCQKPQYNQFYSASSNIGSAHTNLQNSLNADGSVKGNLRHPTLAGNCITPICSGSSASFCTIQAEYPSNRRSVLPSSSSYGPRRYVEKTQQDFNKTNQLICCCLGNRDEFKEFEGKFGSSSTQFSVDSFNEAQHCELESFEEQLDEANGYYSPNMNYNKNCTVNFNESYDKNYLYAQDLEGRLRNGNNLVEKIFSSCAPCNYGDTISSEYSLGNCFVDN
ncbi:hypothetical protein HWI79_760 [Cryptosporidium felis]|nr:hypothetical protein HWI79_760 [Cryptosporidium felis]